MSCDGKSRLRSVGVRVFHCVADLASRGFALEPPSLRRGDPRRPPSRAWPAWSGGVIPGKYIVKEPGYCSGKAAIGATRVRVNNVVFLHKHGRDGR